MQAPSSLMYPVSAKAYKDIHDSIGLQPQGSAIELMLEALVEYEHGSVDLANNFVTLEQYADVLVDLALVIHHGSK